AATSAALYAWAEATAYTTPFVTNPADRFSDNIKQTTKLLAFACLNEFPIDLVMKVIKRFYRFFYQ
ncbi:MAG: hypothetical protein CMK83_02005, partial [Pseudomonadales bacterium]|nr:hypothetical protein [Pseudomonadales bacterium]